MHGPLVYIWSSSEEFYQAGLLMAVLLKYSNHQSVESVISFTYTYTNSEALDMNAFVTYCLNK